MELEQIQKYWADFFNSQVERLVKNGDIIPTFAILPKAGDMLWIAVEGAAMNNEKAKAALARDLRAKIKEVDGVAVMSILDTFIAQIKGQDATKRPPWWIGKMTVSQAADLGLCEKRECLIATVESPILQEMKRQFYRREPRDSPNVILEERDAPEGGYFAGRFSGFFRETTSKAAEA